ncbi:hypothetical protein M0Q39_01765 [Patescibacteria group bacterium]|nr:hypothetical protein [Patescibacteria group bacterium]
MFKYDKTEVTMYLSEFIWNFNIGGNIIYNFKILFLLYEAKKNGLEEDAMCYNKPITIFLVSIIEAILIDLLIRLDNATNDLPECLASDDVLKIKSKIGKDKRQKERIDVLTGEAQKYYAMKRYDFKEIIDYCRKFNLLFSENGNIYKYLDNFAWLRNRIHIENYHKNFEPNEEAVFTGDRLEIMEKTINYILSVMANRYGRKLNKFTKKENLKAWLILIN